jgi:hypothetical protein
MWYVMNNVTKECTTSTKSDEDDVDVALQCQIVSFHKSENSTTNRQMKTEKKEKHQPDWTVNGIMAPLVN